jgi:alpha-glucosidase
MVFGFFAKTPEDKSLTGHVKKWWKEATVYQVYPASFYDSNGDGIGDLRGIISKLDYIKSIGVDVVWLSPHYKSPQVDMGYDISDYKDINDAYGTLADNDELIKGCHDRGLKIVFDLVVNHTSDQHAWFQESRKSKTSPKRDWYIWRPAKIDQQGNRVPPNNWASYFGGSAWEWDDDTQEYYLHLFTKEQPDLNWENQQVREAVYRDAINFWLDKGVDGFRIDTAEIYSKPPGLPDAPVTDPHAKYQHPGKMCEQGPQLHEILHEMNMRGFSRYDTMTVGEGQTQTYDQILDYVSAARKELNMLFQFDLFNISVDRINKKIDPYPLTKLKDVVSKWQRLIIGRDGWTTAFLENHDGGRSVSRFLDDSPQHRVASAKLLAAFLATQSGTLYVYQGQEIGMINVPEDWDIEQYVDVESKNAWNVIKERSGGDPDAMKGVMKFLRQVARDNSRTPVQWDATQHAGFTTGTPWMPVNPVYPEINVESQLWDPHSPLAFWRWMLKFRKAHAGPIIYGDFETVDYDNPSVFSYTKTHGDECILVALNFTGESVDYSPETVAKGNFRLLTSSCLSHVDGKLKPYEAVIYQRG